MQKFGMRVPECMHAILSTFSERVVFWVSV